jgi:tetratricopeptide (TPR) repeat protein
MACCESAYGIEDCNPECLDDLMTEGNQKAEPGADKAWPFVMSWVGRTSALIGLFVSVAGGVTWLVHRHQQTAERQAQMATAEAQAKQGQYQAAVESYGVLLKSGPLDRAVLDAQLNTTMAWVEDFHVPARENQSGADVAAPELDEILTILSAGLTRSKGTQAADVQAHIGWTHWLNQRIADRDYGPAAEQNLRAALATDAENVYANAMLGAWMIQNDGNFSEAIGHLNTAVTTGKARPFVRKLQLGALVDLDKKNGRIELMKAANDIRKSGEPMDEEFRKRILDSCFDPIVTDHGEMAECLTAVKPDEAWQTYLWLEDKDGETHGRNLDHDFVEANLLELTGRRQESLEKYRALQQELKGQSGTMKSLVNAAIVRLSRG